MQHRVVFESVTHDVCWRLCPKGWEVLRLVWLRIAVGGLGLVVCLGRSAWQMFGSYGEELYVRCERKVGSGLRFWMLCRFGGQRRLP